MKCKARALLRAAGAVLVLGTLGACATAPIREIVPEARVSAANVEGMPASIRFWSDASADDLRPRIEERRKAALARNRKSGPPKKIEFLTLSGGGADGAFGSGFLIGWREAGTRPEFEVVTGISTGALIAPLAFLGEKYDPQLRTMFTSISQKDILEDSVSDVLSGVFGGNALVNNSGLKKMIAKFATNQMLADIAVEHNKGRILLIGTTNIDAQRSVIWDMGEIASSGHRDALPLFRKILLASASIPGAFPPVFIKVNAGGKEYQEMHVDGGVTTQVFLFPTRLKVKSDTRIGRSKTKINLYIIRNTKIAPEWQATEAGVFSIASRSMATLIKRQGIGDLIRMYARAKRDNFDYNLASIPKNFEHKAKSMFDNVYMKALYQVGYEEARKGYRWKKTPPGF